MSKTNEPGALADAAVRTREPVKHPGGWRRLTVTFAADEFEVVPLAGASDEVIMAFLDGLRAVLGVKGTFSIGGVVVEP